MTSCASVAPLSKRMKASARSSTSKALPDWAAASQVIGPQVLPITQVGLAPLQRAVRAHQPAENLREKARVQHDQAHALQHVAVPMASGSAPGSKAGGRPCGDIPDRARHGNQRSRCHISAKILKDPRSPDDHRPRASVGAANAHAPAQRPVRGPTESAAPGLAGLAGAARRSDATRAGPLSPGARAVCEVERQHPLSTPPGPAAAGARAGAAVAAAPAACRAGAAGRRRPARQQPGATRPGAPLPMPRDQAVAAARAMRVSSRARSSWAECRSRLR